MLFGLFRNKKKELAQARTKLIYDLEHNGIENLIKSMGHNEPYSDIIIEQRKKGNYSSTDSVSWYAYQVSNDLNNPNDKPELFRLLQDKKYQHYQKYIYCCLASLCSNTNDYQLFDFLLKQIELEKDESIIISVLSRLKKISKPLGTDISIIKEFVLEGTADLRRVAITALSNSQDNDLEQLLLNEFKVSSKEVKTIICHTLMSVGTKKSIPILQIAFKQTRDGYLRMSIEDTIRKIEEREKIN